MKENKEKNQEQVTKQPEQVNPAQTPGNYAIVTESGGQRRIFAVFNGTVQIVPMSALGGAFELK